MRSGSRSKSMFIFARSAPASLTSLLDHHRTGHRNATGRNDTDVIRIRVSSIQRDVANAVGVASNEKSIQWSNARHRPRRCHC